MSNTLVAEATARFLSPQLLSLFKGFTLTTVAPIIIIVIFTVIVVNILASLLADSPGPYPHFGKKLAVTAADLWDNRRQYGILQGRNLNSFGPFENILDGISESIKKWEETPLYSTVPNSIQDSNNISKGLQASASYNVPTNSVQSSPHFISAAPSTGKIRFQ